MDTIHSYSQFLKLVTSEATRLSNMCTDHVTDDYASNVHG